MILRQLKAATRVDNWTWEQSDQPHPQRPETEKAAKRAIVSHVNLQLTSAFRLPEGLALSIISQHDEQNKTDHGIGWGVLLFFFLYTYIHQHEQEH